MGFKKWVKSIQTAGYNGARTVIGNRKAMKDDLNDQMNLNPLCKKKTKLCKNLFFQRGEEGKKSISQIDREQNLTSLEVNKYQKFRMGTLSLTSVTKYVLAE